MSKNLELKIQINSFNEIINKLEKLNANFVKELIQKDIYYSVNKGLLKLRKQNEKKGELIKYLRDENGRDRFSDYEILLVNPGTAEKFFGELFETETVVEKKRQLFMFKDTRIHLDDVEKLGNFLELETLVTRGEKDAKKEFDYVVDKLNINLKNQIRKSYRDLKLMNKK